MDTNAESERNVMKEKRQNLTGNTLIKEVKQEVEEESEDVLQVPISENNWLKEDKKEEEEEPSSESEDDITISQYFRSKGKQVDCSSLDELETPLEANERPLGIERKLQCLYSDSAEEAPANSRTQERKRKIEKDNGNVQDNDQAMKRAEEAKAKLDKRFPSFLKTMSRTHVSRSFWLPIPSDFSKPNMPKDDQIIILEDETGKGYEVKYIAGKMALSAGWRGFSIGQNLHEGDVVIFHLVRFDKFKVYIVRASSSSEIDVAIDDSNLDSDRRDEQKINGEDSPFQKMDSGHNSSFVKFHDFNITVNGTNLDSLLAKDVCKNYYELCLARNSYLHHHLKSNNDMLAAGIISETTKIADYIKGSKLSTSSKDFTMWDKTLEWFELLGMDVGFLRARSKYLEKIAIAMRESLQFKEYKEARIQRDGVDEEIQNLKSRIHELECAKRKLESDINALKVEFENFELIFEAEANTPWSRDP